ncbi:MAG: laminin G domain-containing protein [Lentisphaeria bacterium]|nr:laminin G domain-containing protein [Lentisphaeria bacterium]
MRHRQRVRWSAALLLPLLLAVLATAAPRETLVAEWDFSRGVTASADGRFTGTLRGATKVVDGLLLMAPGYEDKGEGLLLDKVYPELTPAEGFRLEITFQHRLELRTEQPQQLLWDNKYLLAGNYQNAKGNHDGFAVALVHGGGDAFTPYVWLGLGTSTKVCAGTKVSLPLGQPHTITVAYNGASRLEVSVNGAPNKSFTFTEGGPLSPAIRPTVIGDRCGSTHNRFDGGIARVRLTTYPMESLTLTLPGRAAFVRGEEGAALTLLVTNQGKADLHGVAMAVAFSEQLAGILPSRRIIVGDLAAKERRAISLPVETRLRPGKYPFAATLTANDAQGEVTLAGNFEYTVGPQLPPDSMPVLMWGGGSPLEVVLDHGFTHDLGGFASRVLRSTDLADTAFAVQRTLDEYVATGLRRSSYFTLAHDKALTEQFPRRRRDGSVVPRNAEASNPEYQAILGDTAEKTAQIIKDHPGCDALLINSEVRDSTAPSFGAVEPAAFQAFAGFPIPDEVMTKSAPHYSRVMDFPLGRVISPDHRLLVFYRWFWKQGDGWNPVQTLVNNAYHKHISRPFWTFFDPTVRVPPVWGSGGNVDYVSHWTYAYPDPLRTGSVTDELRAMADGRPGQDVMSMTQIICYRSATAPQSRNPDPTPAWALEQPDAKFISLPPDSLRASIWAKISRRVQGIMFHGSGSLWGAPSIGSYFNTNPETAVMLKKVIGDVVKPLGPTLKRIPERSPEVAILHSFASSVFAGRGTWGWQGWLLDAHLMLQWANLAPAVVYEEKLLRDGFGDLKVLCLFHCDVLTAPVYEAIKAFQAKGGIIVADECLVPGIVPDILVKSYKRQPEAEPAKAELQAMAAELRRQLDPYYRAYADASNPDLVTRVRTYGQADYLFVINDHRTYGDYLGPWKLTMEKGLPNRGAVTVRRGDVKSAFDLVAHCPVPFVCKRGVTTLDVDFSTNDGRLILLLDHDLPKLRAAWTADRKVKVTMARGRGQVSKALYPIRIDVVDPDGKVMDGSGHACAVDGDYLFAPAQALNDQPGVWKVRVTELASNQQVELTFAVR